MLDTAKLLVPSDGAYELEVQALDLAGNTGSLRLPFTLANEL